MKIKVFKNIITRKLPKTGQTTAYIGGDDGQFEFGWWERRYNADNRTRFILDATGDFVVDRTTNIMWPRDWAPIPAADPHGYNHDWATGIIMAEALVLGGYNDWHMPNRLELLSLVRHEGAAPLIHNIFVNCPSDGFWTSTTVPINVLDAFSVTFSNGVSTRTVKTASIRCAICRQI